MNSESSTPPSASRKAFKFALILMAIITAGLVLFVVIRPSTDDDVVWLNAAQLARTTQPGLLLTLKYKVMRLTAPVWQRFFRNRTISIEGRLMAFSPEAAQQIVLGTALSTNSDGARVWILSPDELKTLKQHLSTASGASVLSGVSITTSDGGQARVSSGGIPPTGTNSGSPACTMDVLPQIFRGSIRLTISMSSTEALSASGGGSSHVKTNLSVACRVIVPNAGAIMLAGGKTNAATGESYWMRIAPVVVDARGNPIKKP